MSRFDGRHKWGPVEQDGARIKRTCTACGRTDEAETLVPNGFVDALLRTIRGPVNPYRKLVG